MRVDSEVGRLRQVIVHRPGLELTRLTPENCHDLLFDGVMWAERAQEEHDTFRRLLTEHGVRVHLFGDLLAETLAVPEARAFVLDRVTREERHGPALAGSLRAMADDLDPARLAEVLIGGVTAADVSPLRVASLTWRTLQPEDFVLPPLPNTLFQRDSAAWLYGGVTVNAMAKPPRAASRSTPARSIASTRCSPALASSATSATPTRTCSRPRWRAATSTSSATVRCSSG